MKEEERKVSGEQGTEEVRAGIEEGFGETAGERNMENAEAAERTEASESGKEAASEAGAPEPGAEEACRAEETEVPEAGSEASEKRTGGEENALCERQLAEWQDKYTRLYAEFDNFRKRTEKEKSQMFELGARDVIEKLLPVADNFERALQTVQEEDREDAFTKGVDGIYRQIQKLFSDLEVKAIEAEGQKFDPALHNAVMTDTEGDAEEDTVTQDLLKGYTFRGTVIRHSMVKVKK